MLSNSLSFLLTKLNDGLTPGYQEYEEDLCDVIKGFKRSRTHIPTKAGRNIRICANETIILSDSDEVTFTGQRNTEKFENFEDYYVRLIEGLKSTIANATSEKREQGNFGLISSISRGYDATAVSALLKDLGVYDVMTFINDADDDGSAIATKLGFQNVHKLNSKEYLDNELYLEAASAANGNIGVSVCFTAYPKLLQGKILFMGTRGDSTWSKVNPNFNTEFDFTFGNALTQADIMTDESSLRQRMIYVHVPVFGASAWPDLHRISNSPEMFPFSVGGDYDRPIPRRIIEGTGVNRNQFGMHKHGAGISYHFDTMSSLKKKMSKMSFASFKAYRSGLKKGHYLQRFARNIKYFRSEYPAYFNYAFSKFKLPFKFKRKTGMISSVLANDLIIWGVAEMKKLYKPYI